MAIQVHASTAGLAARVGPRPATTPINPHQQLEQNAPMALQSRLIDAVTAWPGVSLGPSIVSGEGAQAFLLAPELANGPPAAFFGPTTEFAHIHAPFDGSLHAKLAPQDFAAANAQGWGEPHPMAARLDDPPANLMLYGPRDDEELAVVLDLLNRSYRFARGTHR